MRKYWAIVMMALLMLCAESIAHRLKVFASTEGDRVKGYAYFPGGGEAKSCRIEIRNPAGVVLGVATTDQKGAFTYLPTNACDHRFLVSSGDGHRDEFTLSAGHLPVGLSSKSSKDVADEISAEGPSPVRVDSAAFPDDLSREVVDRMITERVRPLREEVEALREERRISKLIGGVGFIVGFFGLVFFLAGRKRGRLE